MSFSFMYLWCFSSGFLVDSLIWFFFFVFFPSPLLSLAASVCNTTHVCSSSSFLFPCPYLSFLLFSMSSISSQFPWSHPFLLIYLCSFSSYILCDFSSLKKKVLPFFLISFCHLPSLFFHTLLMKLPRIMADFSCCHQS